MEQTAGHETLISALLSCYCGAFFLCGPCIDGDIRLCHHCRHTHYHRVKRTVFLCEANRVSMYFHCRHTHYHRVKRTVFPREKRALFPANRALWSRDEGAYDHHQEMAGHAHHIT